MQAFLRQGHTGPRSCGRVRVGLIGGALSQPAMARVSAPPPFAPQLRAAHAWVPATAPTDRPPAGHSPPKHTHTHTFLRRPPPSQLDWRALLRHIRLPCLNCAGGTSGVFPLEGLLEVGRLVPDCCSVVFDRANHWLYVEQPAEFNELLLDFVRRGNEGRAKLAHVP